MLKYNKLKQKIYKYKNKANNWNNWMYRYKLIRDNFSEMSLENLTYLASNDSDLRVKSIATNRLNILLDYNIRKDFNNVVTIKLIIPSGCNANCSFCYVNSYKDNITINKENFLNNFIYSLNKVVSRIDGAFPISLDITGNEPTFDIELLKKTLNILRNSPILSKFCRVTLTTNGYNLLQVINELAGTVNYVNISVHDYSKNIRKNIFNTTDILDDVDYKHIIFGLLKYNIECSAVAVITEKFPINSNWINSFVSWCKEVGFISLRIRNNSFNSNRKEFDDKVEIIIKECKLEVINKENNNDSNWCRVSDKEGFLLYFLNGVLNTYEVSKGIEYIIHEDGNAYMDYYKKVSLENYTFPTNLIFDKKENL